ncbi:MAG: hypothetical protein P0Y49_18690 [Candidatus Pedobacter colombiensis]|uniref:Outer membrane protein beta-barrel domain-containing protein n=1 Tax=Candidatus Pedobacter colombiensis TaxID=3121371 RepID=A0AAJ5W9H7_9SPHI|nr:hypothetical protein [Pedobacter sp.]WEK18807.1 MAG: hypothetical protein P0Y49_18690 [Pedobacter sp.]
MKRHYLFFFLLIFSKKLSAQQEITPSAPAPKIGKSIFGNEVKRNFSRKGDFFVTWGYNHSWYANSDINFKGPGYDFTLRDVVAQDRQTKLSWKYLDPKSISIPQFNFHFGYFIKDNYSISLGWDHMKYVMDIPQKVRIDGHIDPMVSSPAVPTGRYAGVYNGEMLEVGPDMLVFEHTDGLNYASAELERYDDIWVPRSQRTSLTMETGIGAGLVVPRTDAHLFGVGKNNYWNVAGWGVSAKLGFKFYITKGLYLQNSTKVGYIDLSKIHTTGRDDIDGASQNIKYIENYTILGFQF